MILPFDARLLDKIADAINPLLTILLIGAIIWRRRADAHFPIAQFFFRSLLAIIAAVILGRINEALHLWPGLPTDRRPYEFPSGHMCYAVSVAVSLVLIHRRWLFFVVPLLAFYGTLIVLPPLSYHSGLDIVGAGYLTAPIALLCHRIGRRKSSVEIKT